MLANGVDVDRFRPDVSGAAVRARYGLGSDLVIGFVGTFGPWHGATVLARAFSTLAREEAGGMRLLLVGDGEEMAGVRLALGGLVDEGRAVLAGAILPQEVPAHLAACDVLVAAHVPNPDGTEFFGSPTKLFEYMASGRAIVASSLGQLAEVLEHGRTALLVEPGSPDDLARAVRRLVTDPVLRRRLGDAAREAAVERHSWKEHTRRIVRALQERCE
jgi:glycosyltransferase involved in cell wall biosynthesis